MSETPSGPEDGQPGRGGTVGRRRQAGLLALVAVLVLAADVTTKVIAVATLEDRDPIRLLGGALYLVFVRNTGAAFGLASGYTVVLSLVAAAVVLVIIRMAWKLYSAGWAVSLGLVLGGAAGNLVDRIFRPPGVLRGAVIDFLSLFDDGGRIWPVFNLADSALCVGVALAVVLELTGRRIDGSRGGRAAGPAS